MPSVGRDRSSRIKTEKYPLNGLTKRPQVTMWILDTSKMIARLMAKSKTEKGAKSF